MCVNSDMSEFFGDIKRNNEMKCTCTIIFPQNKDVKSDTSAGTPLFYMSDESEKRDHSCRFTSSDVDCFKIEEKKKKKVLRKRRRKIKTLNSSLETVKEDTIKAKLSPTVCGKDVKSILNTVKSDTCKEIDVNVTVIFNW